MGVRSGGVESAYRKVSEQHALELQGGATVGEEKRESDTTDMVRVVYADMCTTELPLEMFLCKEKGGYPQKR